jgi:hypothetical protein
MGSDVATAPLPVGVHLVFNGLGNQARFEGFLLASEEEPPNVFCNLHGFTNNLSEI